MLGLPPPKSNPNPNFYVFLLVHATWVTVTFKNLSRSRVPEKMDYHEVCTGARQDVPYIITGLLTVPVHLPYMDYDRLVPVAPIYVRDTAGVHPVLHTGKPYVWLHTTFGHLAL